MWKYLAEDVAIILNLNRKRFKGFCRDLNDLIGDSVWALENANAINDGADLDSRSILTSGNSAGLGWSSSNPSGR